MPPELVAFGEIGLTGEIRPVPYGEERLREAAEQGFARAWCRPQTRPRQAIEGLEVIAVQRLGEAVARLSADRGRTVQVVEACASGEIRTVLIGVLACLQDFHRVVPDVETGSRLRDRLQIFDDQAIEGLRPLGWQVPVHRAIQGANAGPRIDDEAAIRVHMHVLVHHVGGIRRELADDLLEEVLERDQSLQVSILIDDQSDAAFLRWKFSS